MLSTEKKGQKRPTRCDFLLLPALANGPLVAYMNGVDRVTSGVGMDMVAEQGGGGDVGPTEREEGSETKHGWDFDGLRARLDAAFPRRIRAFSLGGENTGRVGPGQSTALFGCPRVRETGPFRGLSPGHHSTSPDMGNEFLEWLSGDAAGGDASTCCSTSSGDWSEAPPQSSISGHGDGGLPRVTATVVFLRERRRSSSPPATNRVLVSTTSPSISSLYILGSTDATSDLVSKFSISLLGCS
jgi:hypothetical protein